MKFIVVAYDISDDRTRARLFKALKRFGQPAQFSVFECLLDEARFAELRRTVALVAASESDNVRYYELCLQCRRQITPLGKATVASLQPVYII